MIYLKTLETSKFSEDGSYMLVHNQEESESENKVMTLGEFLKKWLKKKINKAKKEKKNKEKEYKILWLEENKTIRQKQSIKKAKFKDKVIFSKINIKHPIFKEQTYIFKEFVNTNKNLETKTPSIEIENIDIDKLISLNVKSKLVINQIKETFEIVTNVKVKKLTLYRG